MGKKLEQVVAALNGAVGDYLARTGNGLATEMAFVHHGAALPIDRDALASAVPALGPRVVVLVHGLMCTEDVWTMPDGTDYGSRLAEDVGLSPLYVRYNTGLAIPASGEALAALLDGLVAAWPVPLEEIVLLGYSMGGLVARAACHTASERGLGWLRLVRRALYVGTPHLGAPLERVSRVATSLLGAVGDPVARLIADVVDLRSDGIKDLGDGDVHEEARARRTPTVKLRDGAHPVPLLPSMRHHLVAGSLSSDPRLAALFGDLMVPVPSGTAGRAPSGSTPAATVHDAGQVRVLPGLDHVTLAHHPDVYAQLRAWCEETP